MALKAKPTCCEEAAMGMGNAYFPCNKPATKIIGVKDGGEGPYRMCDACADHSIRNRSMVLIGPYDQYDFWSRRLAGAVIPIHDGEFHAGFYRNNRQDGSSQPVAIWFTPEGDVKLKIDNLKTDPENVYNTPVDQPDRRRTLGDIWTYISERPVSHEDYKTRVSTGNWPGENAVVTRSNNAPADDTIEGIKAAIDELVHEAKRLMAGGAAQSKTVADEASDVAEKLGKLNTKADNLRKVEGQPFLDAKRDIDAKWGVLTDAASIYKKLKDVVCEPFLKAQKRIKEEAERKAREDAQKAADAARELEREAQRKADEAKRSGDAEAARQADKLKNDAIAARSKADDKEATALTVAATPVTVGSRGRRTSLRSVTKVTIVDRAAVIEFFKDRQEFIELLQSMAEKMVRAGATVPGTEVSKEQDAA